MFWRLGIDLGTNSLGWCAIRLNEASKPVNIIAAGSRIFSDGRDPKSGASNAVDRRDARAMRRRLDRLKQRQAALLKYLALDGLFPDELEAQKALEGLDPYALRASGLDKKLELYHLGRAIFHMNQRRGFKSNRKTDRPDDDSGKIATGIDRLRQAMLEMGARTFGEFLHKRRSTATDANSIPSVRTRLRPETAEGAKGDGYDFYPGRDLLEEEFDILFDVQSQHHPDVLTQAVHDRLFEIVFNQRPLKKPKIGKCSLPPHTDERLPKSHPLFQKRRLLEELNALMVVRSGAKAEKLTKEQRDILLLKLKDKRKVTFASMRKEIKLDSAARFNKESEQRTELLGDEVAAELGSKTRFGNRWVHLTVEKQWEVIARLSAVESDKDADAFRNWLEATYNLSAEESVAVLKARLPEGYGRFGETATRKLIVALQADVIVYSEAVIAAGLGHHSDHRTGEVLENLPYYGNTLERFIMPGTSEPSDPEEMRVGRISNPTVHIGLNQLRKTVNALIKSYGRPTEIAIELARELKLTQEEKDRRNKENNANRKAAEDRSKKLRETTQTDNGSNRALLKLWEELNPANVLDRRCIYTGQQISIDMLFNGSVEVDHILPFKDTLDDGNGNKILCMREANRLKRKRSPYAAFGHTADWDAIAERASRLPRSKRWRFEPDAMQKFDKDGGFLARQLVDTQYLSRLAREYLTALYPEKGEESSKVWVSPGRLTEMVRRKLGLNDLLPDHNFGGGADQPKNRLDHRHHAIDAAVIAIVDRSMLQNIARASGLEGEEGRERIHVPPPWEGFRDDLRQTVGNIVVAHRADHGTYSKAGLKKGKDATAGRLHNDTAYGLTGEKDAKGNALVVHRVPLGSLGVRNNKPKILLSDLLSDIKKVRDQTLRDHLSEFANGSHSDYKKRIQEFPELGPLPYRRIRRLRIIEPLKVIPIRDATGRAYKGYKGDSNARFDVWELKDGKWVSEVVSTFDAHQQDWVSSVRANNPTAKKILSLKKDDLIMIERQSTHSIVRVVKFSDGSLVLAETQEGGSLKTRDADKEDPFKYIYSSLKSLKEWKARQVRIDILGRVQDPGFPARKAVRKTRPKLST